MDIKDLWAIYDANKEWIKFADAKAIAIIAIIGVIFNILYSLINTVICNNSLIIKGAYFLTLIFLSLSLFFSLCCLIPRTSKLDKNLIYYKAINNCFSNEEEYMDEIKLIENSRFKEQISIQIYQLSNVASKKYQKINYSLVFFGFGMFTFLVFSILIIFKII